MFPDRHLVWSATSSGPRLGDDELFANSMRSAIEEGRVRSQLGMLVQPNLRADSGHVRI